MSSGFASFHRRLGLGVGLRLGLGVTAVAVPAALLACTSEVTGTDTGDPSASGTTPPPTTPAPTATTTATTDKPAPPAEKDAGTDAAPSTVTLQVSGGTYKNTTAAGGGFVYSVDFVIANTSSEDVASIDAMTFDLGGTDQVKLTKAPCKGSFPIAAGAKKTIQTQVVVSNAGSVTMFSFICPGFQELGGASGKAPGTTSYAGPVTITVGGKTSSGTFTATGTATRSN